MRRLLCTWQSGRRDDHSGHPHTIGGRSGRPCGARRCLSVQSAGQTHVVDNWRSEVAQWWADVLLLPTAVLRAGGVFADSHHSHVGVIAIARAIAPVVYGPAGTLPALRRMLEQASTARVIDPARLSAELGRQAGGARASLVRIRHR